MSDRPNILVVEDEAITALDLEETLSLTGFQAGRVVSSGEEAIAAAAQTAFDLVLSDIVLAGEMDGVEAAKQIRAVHGTPVVFLTAYGDHATLARASAAEPFGYLIKPFHAEALRATVETALRRSRLERDLAARETQLRQLTGMLISAREDERAHVAREIHDDLGQTLTLLRMDLAWIRAHPDMPADDAQKRQVATIQTVDQAIASVRRIASALRPPVLDNSDVGSALDWQCREFSQRTGIQTTFVNDVPLAYAAALPMDYATVFFRILQEALTNVARHADARSVVIAFGVGTGSMELCITDDGRGLSTTATSGARSLGLVGMRERALLVGGQLVLRAPASGTGTEVWLSLPFAGVRPEDAR